MSPSLSNGLPFDESQGSPFKVINMEEKKLTSTKRFRARYGRRLKERLAKIENEYKKGNKCPYCGKNKVKRLSIGIWFCDSCKSKFTGKAYSITKKIVTKEKVEAPEKIEEIEEQEESHEEESKEAENVKV